MLSCAPPPPFNPISALQAGAPPVRFDGTVTPATADCLLVFDPVARVFVLERLTDKYDLSVVRAEPARALPPVVPPVAPAPPAPAATATPPRRSPSPDALSDDFVVSDSSSHHSDAGEAGPSAVASRASADEDEIVRPGGAAKRARLAAAASARASPAASQ